MASVSSLNCDFRWELSIKDGNCPMFFKIKKKKNKFFLKYSMCCIFQGKQTIKQNKKISLRCIQRTTRRTTLSKHFQFKIHIQIFKIFYAVLKYIIFFIHKKILRKNIWNQGLLLIPNPLTDLKTFVSIKS